MKKTLLALVALAYFAAPISNAGTTPIDVAPYKQAAAVTPNDGADLSALTKALWVGGAGNLNVDFSAGPTVLISGIPAGTLLPFKIKRVRSTNTTATLIVALY